MPAPAVDVDVIDSRDKNWETKRNVKGVFSSQNNSCDVVQSEMRMYYYIVVDLLTS